MSATELQRIGLTAARRHLLPTKQVILHVIRPSVARLFPERTNDRHPVCWELLNELALARIDRVLFYLELVRQPIGPNGFDDVIDCNLITHAVINWIKYPSCQLDLLKLEDRRKIHHQVFMRTPRQLKDEIRGRVSEIRATLKMTRKEFAHFLEANPESYYKYESGKYAFPSEVLLAIREKTGFSIDYIISGETGYLSIAHIERLQDLSKSTTAVNQ
ncbi:MAG: helix-turn-helix transcriptional regulator [Pseudomonadota bacterium]